MNTDLDNIKCVKLILDCIEHDSHYSQDEFNEMMFDYELIKKIKNILENKDINK
jgi:hypothetical protein